MSDLLTELRAAPPQTRIGSFLKRIEEQRSRDRVNDQLRLAAMGVELERLIDEAMERDPTFLAHGGLL